MRPANEVNILSRDYHDVLLMASARGRWSN